MKIGDLAIYVGDENNKWTRSDCFQSLGGGEILGWQDDLVQLSFIVDPKGWKSRWINIKYLKLADERNTHP